MLPLVAARSRRFSVASWRPYVGPEWASDSFFRAPSDSDRELVNLKACDVRSFLERDLRHVVVFRLGARTGGTTPRLSAVGSSGTGREL